MPVQEPAPTTVSANPTTAPQLDGTTVANRLRAAEQAGTPVRRLELIGTMGRLLTARAQRTAEQAADDIVIARVAAELEAIEKADSARARALAPSTTLYLTMGEACGMAGCNEATMRKKIRKHGFGWLVDRRWRISRPDLLAHLAALDG